MINCISVENMRNSDAYTIANKVDGVTLMYRAAYGIFKAVHWQGRTAIVVGSGNNGGDGYALACILQDHGFDCEVIAVGQKMSSDARYFSELASEKGVPIIKFDHTDLTCFDVVVDCLLGTGFSGAVRDNYRDAILAINHSGSFVVSVDINSGMNGDSGEAELAVRSDLTVTIGYVKNGLITHNAGNYIKRLVCADIGIILLEEELKICAQDEILCPGCVRCPSWLDMETIDVREITLA